MSLLIICLTERAQLQCIMCTNDCSLTSLKQFLNLTQQKSVNCINICCKVTFGFKYIKFSLRKHTYSNILKISQPKTKSFQIKIQILFHISAQNIDCGYLLELPQQGNPNKYPQSMFFSRNKKNNVYPCKPQFYHIKVGFKGGQNYIGIFS